MKITGSFIMRKIAGETVLVPTSDTSRDFNGMITLNETAKFIWEHLEEVGSREELATLMTKEFEVEYERAFLDVTNTVRMLYRSGFVTPSKEDRSW